MAATAGVEMLATDATRPAWLVRFDTRAEAMGAHTGPEKADLMGVSRETYWRYGNGMLPRLPKGQDIARRIGMTFGELFREDES